MSDTITKEFTQEQVDMLNIYQLARYMHPFTCGSGNRTDEHHKDGEGILIATADGWKCPFCDYTQDWAYGFMASLDNNVESKVTVEDILYTLRDKLKQTSNEEHQKLWKRAFIKFLRLKVASYKLDDILVYPWRLKPSDFDRRFHLIPEKVSGEYWAEYPEKRLKRVSYTYLHAGLQDKAGYDCYSFLDEMPIKDGIMRGFVEYAKDDIVECILFFWEHFDPNIKFHGLVLDVDAEYEDLEYALDCFIQKKDNI